MEISQYHKHDDLVERCKQGEQKAYAEIYKLYAKAMFNICYRITRNQEVAEDVLQEAFLNAFQHIGSFQRKASFGAWLKKIVVNKAISHLRRQQVQFDELDDRIDAVPEESDIDEMDLCMKVETIKSAIMKLPNGFRVVFSLYLLEGYDHKEIAEILGISESTSKTQYNRAKKKLKELLKEEVYYE